MSSKRSGSVRCALSLLAASVLFAANVFAANNDDRVADAAQNQDRTLVRSLLKQHADVNGVQADRTSALTWAAHWGDLEIVDLLLAAGADAKIANRYGTSALSEAATIGNAAIVEKLLKAGADPNSVSQNNESALMAAARAGSVETAKLLLDHGANVNARDTKDEETPLMYAVFQGHLPVVKLLISRGADVNAVAHTLDLPRRSQPSAAIFGSRYTGGFTALMFAARQDYVEIARALLEAGADPNVSDRDGMTPMIISALNGSFETGALLLEKGADPNDGTLWEIMEFRNYRGEEDAGRILPKITSKLDSLDFVKMLLAHGADPTRPYGKVRTLNKYAGTNPGQPNTTAPLDRALDAVDLASLRVMLDHAVAKGIKFDLNAILMTEVRAFPITGPGKMVFRVVTDKDIADAITMAIGYGADVNSTNLLGNTALHLAAQQGMDDVVKLLASKGAKLDAKNKAGLTPLDFAMGKGNAVVEGRGGGGRGAALPQEHLSTVALLQQLMAGPTALNTTPEKQ